jgi:hypothetical protein
MTKKSLGAGKAPKPSRSPGGGGGGGRGGKSGPGARSGGGAGGGAKPKHSMDPVGRPKGGAGGQRSESTVKRLAMYKQRPVRDAKGKVLFEQYQSKAMPSTRIIPDRRWFGNTRVVGQAALEQFRTDMAATDGDAYTVVLKGKSLPLALLADPEKARRPARASILGTQSFADTFGTKAQRKRPATGVDTYEELLSKARRVTAACVCVWRVARGGRACACGAVGGGRARAREARGAHGARYSLRRERGCCAGRRLALMRRVRRARRCCAPACARAARHARAPRCRRRHPPAPRAPPTSRTTRADNTCITPPPHP